MTSKSFKIFCISIAVLFFFESAFSSSFINYYTGTDTSISYDDANRVTSVSDLSGTTSWTYNEAYELIALSTPQGGLEYEYDNLGRLWKLIKNETATTEYGYDDASRLVSILNPYNELTEFEYDDDSKLIRKLFANGTKEEYSYDERNRLLGIVLKKSNNDVLSSHQYVYDAVSNIVQRTSNGVTTEFTYDLIDQLLTETKQGYSAEYTYDANGNRLTRTVNSVTETYEYDDADKLLSVSINENPVKEYTYDACGRLIEVESSAGVTTLSWDYEDRLIGITYPNQSTNSFSYNAFGSRTSKSDSTGNYTYLRDGTSVLAPILSDGYAAYTPGISERRNNNSTFYHSDLKNTTTQTNSSETVSGTNQYDAFGNIIDYDGTWKGPFAYGGAFGYQTDNDSGLMLLGHRYYDSSTGRFLSKDPAEYGSNWYTYCNNNPISYVDPDGNIPFAPLLGGFLFRGVVWVGKKLLTRVAAARATATTAKELLRLAPETFRQNLLRWQGIATAPVATIAHHLIPYLGKTGQYIQQLLQKLSLNINPHHPQFGAWVPESAHKLKKLHDEYTRRVIQLLEGWVKEGFKPTEKDLIEATKKITQEVFK